VRDPTNLHDTLRQEIHAPCCHVPSVSFAVPTAACGMFCFFGPREAESGVRPITYSKYAAPEICTTPTRLNRWILCSSVSFHPAVNQNFSFPVPVTSLISLYASHISHLILSPHTHAIEISRPLNPSSTSTIV